MKAVGFGNEVKCVEQGLCPFCKNVIKMEDFKTPLDLKENKISGLCQKCITETFG